jgi:hypothetical protein
MNNNIEDAETFLQISARWAETPVEQLVSLSNNGMFNQSILSFLW